MTSVWGLFGAASTMKTAFQARSLGGQHRGKRRASPSLYPPTAVVDVEIRSEQRQAAPRTEAPTTVTGCGPRVRSRSHDPGQLGGILLRDRRDGIPDRHE